MTFVPSPEGRDDQENLDPTQLNLNQGSEGSEGSEGRGQVETSHYLLSKFTKTGGKRREGGEAAAAEPLGSRSRLVEKVKDRFDFFSK